MLKHIFLFSSLLFSVLVSASHTSTNYYENVTYVYNEPNNNCVQFTVSSGTGCAWMCNYCANELGTNNYYFLDSVCTYQPGGCVGNPIAGQMYTCCSV